MELKQKTTDYYIAGIDYSLTSPSVCVTKIENGEFKYENSKFYFLRQSKHQQSIGRTFICHEYPSYSSAIERYDKLASWTLENLVWYTGRVQKVFIEDFAFSATGRVFNIAENVGVLKKRLYDAKISFECIPPTVIKKFATGKGNAKKEVMYDAFYQESKVDLQSSLSPKSKNIGNPVSDIVDAYYITKTGYFTLDF